MRTHASLTLLAIALSTASASAVTTLTSATLDFDGGSWDDGLPSSTNPGEIDSNFTNTANHDMSAFPNTTITQTAGTGTVTHFNFHSQPTFTYTIEGGAINMTGGNDFFVNGTNFVQTGGSVDTTNDPVRVVNGGSFVLNGGTFTSGTQTVVAENGSITISDGTLTTAVVQVRVGSFELSGGTIIQSNTGVVVGVNGNATSVMNPTVDLSGGTIQSPASAFLANREIMATISGTFVADATSVVSLFNGISDDNATIDFDSDWTGSLIFDSATDFTSQFEGGDVSLDGTALGAGDFATYFQNSSGVITLIPEPSTALLGMLGAGFLLRRRQRA